MITRRIRQILLHAQIPFYGLDTHVPQSQLYLVQPRPAFMGQLGKRLAQVVRSKFEA